MNYRQNFFNLIIVTIVAIFTTMGSANAQECKNPEALRFFDDTNRGNNTRARPVRTSG